MFARVHRHEDVVLRRLWLGEVTRRERPAGTARLKGEGEEELGSSRVVVMSDMIYAMLISQ